MSSEDIDKGQAWMMEVVAQLDTTEQGLICVTRDNYREPWLNFEAGALARSMSVSRVRPVLLDVAPTDLAGPLMQFQTTLASDRDDMLRLLQSLNSACEEPLDERRLERSFSRTWHEFQNALPEILTHAPPERFAKQRSMEDKIDEALERLRGMDRRTARGLKNLDIRQWPVASVINIDLTAIENSLGTVQKIVDRTTSVSDLLDELYFSIRDYIPPYTYGETWSLKIHDGSPLLRDLGSYWAYRHKETRDDRKLEEAGIPLDAKLVAVRLSTA
ncbi:MAG: hypothetical protein ACRDSP_10195 [Pseudonocardiaceae bacterium]